MNPYCGRGILTLLLASLGCASGPASRAAEPSDAALQQLRDPSVEVRRTAAESLGRAPATTSSAVAALMDALQRDEDVRVRANAAWALGKIPARAEQSVPALVAALQDQDWSVRHNAALSLTWLGTPAERALEKAAAADSERTAAYAISTLQRIEPKKGDAHIAVLRELLASTDEEVRAIAAQSLGVAGPGASDAVPELIRTVADENIVIRGSAVTALGAIGIGAKDAVPALVKLTASGNKSTIRIAAARALARIGHAPEQWIPAVIAMLQPTREESVPSAAIVTLSGLGAAALPYLQDALKDREPSVRGFAIEALGLIGRDASPAASGLVACLNDEHAPVREKAAAALGEIGVMAESVLGALGAATRDSEEAVRTRAQEALNKLTRAAG